MITPLREMMKVVMNEDSYRLDSSDQGFSWGQDQFQQAPSSGFDQGTRKFRYITMMETIFKAMNSTIKLEGMDQNVQLEIEQMFHEFEQKASRFIPNNPLSFINNSPLDVPVYLDETLADLLDQSLKLSRKSALLCTSILGGCHDGNWIYRFF